MAAATFISTTVSPLCNRNDDDGNNANDDDDDDDWEKRTFLKLYCNEIGRTEQAREREKETTSWTSLGSEKL